MSFPRYTEYKDSGVEWLGEVPGHWYAGRFSRAIEAIKDGTHGTFERVPAGRPLLSAKNVQDGYVLVADDESMVSESDHLSITANGFPQKGDLLLTIVGTIGRSCVYEFDDSLAFQRSVCFIRLLQGNETKFFYYFTQSKFFQEQLVSRSKSAAQGGVYMGDVVATSIVYPPLPEQTQIATFLDRETGKIDALVAEQRRLMELLKEKRQAVISHAVTRGLNPHAPKKPSGIEWLGDVPEHWEIGGLTRFIGPVVDYRGRTPTKVDEGIFLVTARNVRDGKIDYEASEEFVDPESAASLLARGKPEIGDLLFTMEAPLGQVALIDRIDIALAQRIVKFRGIPNVMQNRFLLYWFMSTNCQARLETLATGSTALGIKASKLGMIECLVPPMIEQTAIADYIELANAKFDTLTTKAQSAIDLLQERRTALISAAVTGKIDVRTKA